LKENERIVTAPAELGNSSKRLSLRWQKKGLEIVFFSNPSSGDTRLLPLSYIFYMFFNVSVVGFPIQYRNLAG